MIVDKVLWLEFTKFPEDVKDAFHWMHDWRFRNDVALTFDPKYEESLQCSTLEDYLSCMNDSPETVLHCTVWYNFMQKYKIDLQQCSKIVVNICW